MVVSVESFWPDFRMGRFLPIWPETPQLLNILKYKTSKFSFRCLILACAAQNSIFKAFVGA